MEEISLRSDAAEAWCARVHMHFPLHSLCSFSPIGGETSVLCLWEELHNGNSYIGHLRIMSCATHW